MCGITAFFSRGKPVSAATLKLATNALHHRGPDSQGAWLSPNQCVGLGHARLSIIDLTTGDQPIANDACRCAGGLLPQWRTRFMRHAGFRRAEFQLADPGVHAHVRSGRLRRRRHRPRDGGASRREFPAHSGQAVRHRGPLRGRDLAFRDAVQQRPRCLEVPSQPRGARRWLQGRLYRRRLG
jgi:hypothetical protein